MKRLIVLIVLLLMSCVYAADYTCGDRICQANENYNSCPSDCRDTGLDNYCNSNADGVCDADCYMSDPDCSDFTATALAGPGSWWLKAAFVVVFLAGVGAVVFILYRRAAKNQSAYDVNQIDKFSNVKKQEVQTWSNQSEQQIVENIKQSEDFTKYDQQ